MNTIVQTATKTEPPANIGFSCNPPALLASLKNHNKQVRRRNKTYAQSTPAQRRVMIARDALKHIKAKRFKVESYTYLDESTVEKLIESDADIKTAACSIEHCTVCAKGALFMAGARRGIGRVTADEQSTIEGVAYGDASKDLDWPEDNWHLIEMAFEKTQNVSEAVRESWEENAIAGDAAITFGERYKYDRARLEAILRNIIRNNGLFIP